MLHRELERFFDDWDVFLPIPMRSLISRDRDYGRIDYPAVNIWLNDDDAVLTANLPGLSPEDIDVTVSGKSLTISGARKTDLTEKEDTFLRRERWSGQFRRVFDLPFNIEAEQVKAEFKDGVLKVSLPRAEADKPKKIKIAA